MLTFCVHFCLIMKYKFLRSHSSFSLAAACTYYATCAALSMFSADERSLAASLPAFMASAWTTDAPDFAF